MHPALLEHTIPLLDGFPLSLIGTSVAFDLPRQVRLRMRHPEKIKVSDWAQQHRIVSDGAHEGPWRHSYAPHTVKIMDTFGLPHVREVWFCGVEQSGKTNTMINCIGWCIDCDPGGIFYLMPTEDTANKITSGKLKPTIEKSPRLSRYLSARQDDTTMARIKLTHGVTIWPAHANSASSMATWTAKHCFGDEVDKYPATTGKEADPITLIKKRNRNYKGRYKRMFASTPAGLFIYKGVQNCHQVWEYRVKCPHCDEFIKMDAEHLVIQGQGSRKSKGQGSSKDSTLDPGPLTLDPNEVERSGCHYACNECATEWDDATREQAIHSGHWFCVTGADIARPHKVGFHHRAWECLDITLSEIGAAWLRAQQGGHNEKTAWANGYEAIDYIEETKDRHEDTILALRDDRPRDIVPRGAQCLTIQADTQARGFWYSVRAWGWGASTESWKVRSGYVETFADLMTLATADYLDPDGKVYRPAAGIIDSGGGSGPVPQHSRTAEVYEFCRLNPLFRPVKGRRGGDPWSSKRLDYYPSRDGKKRPIPGGLNLYTIDTTLYKNMLAGKLAINPDDPGAFHLDADTGDDYARQMCVEFKDDKGHWECPRGKDNHYWDCEVYVIALADMLQLKLRKKPTEEQKVRPIQQKKNSFIKGWKI
jgi:phage terminase large subunit GpA-like protein